MHRFLLAVDGSENSTRAAEYLLQHVGDYKQPVEVHLINAQAPLTGDITMFISAQQVKQYHEEEGIKALAAVRARFDSAGVPYAHHVGVGESAHVITDYARVHRCSEIVMGTRGLGTVSGVLLGSVATKVVHLSHVPVLLVK